MKLKEYNAENTIVEKPARSSNSILSINQKTGLMCFNKKACELIGVEATDLVAFHQDEEEPENWYVEKVDKKGFLLRSKTNLSSGLLFNNVTIVRSICKSVQFNGKGGRLLIAGKPTELSKGRKLWGLLTTVLRNN